MRKELQDTLVKDFPALYGQIGLPPSQTCMCWGFECGSGWFDIIYNLSQKITELDPECQAVQVKEKFGGLRFYINGTRSDMVYPLISNAEDESYNTCESCGTKENVSQNEYGWIHTLCDTCRTKIRAGGKME